MAKPTAYDLLEIEKLLIKALLEGSSEVRSFILQKFQPEHFENLGEVFALIQETLALGDPSLLKPDVMIHNEKLTPISRGLLQAMPFVALVTEVAQIENATKPLLEAYNSTKLLELLRPSIEGLQKGDLNHDDALAQSLMVLENYNSSIVLGDEPPLELGEGCNFDMALEKTITPSANNFIRSGFDFIDKRVGGYSRGDVIVVASPSSQGKTLMMIQTLNNMLFHNPNTPISALYVTMEVQDSTVMHRIIANRGEHPLVRIREVTQPESLLTEYCKTPEEKTQRLREVGHYRNLAKQEMEKMQKNLSESGNKVRVRNYGAFTPEDLLREMAQYHYDLVVLDYLNLMTTSTPMDADWLRLSNLTRQLKNIATTKKCVIVTAQQLDDEKKDIRYGKAVKEHCDILMKWELPQELRDAGGGLADVIIAKGRNIGTFTTQMYFDLVCQRATEPREGGGEMKTAGLPPAMDPFSGGFDMGAGAAFNPFGNL